jgi:hypothetical protein
MFSNILKPALFTYSHAEIAGMANNTIQNPQINISNDSDFEVFEMRAIINAPAALTGGLLLLLSLASGELFSNVALDAKSFATIDGIANNPISGYPVRYPLNTRIPANSVINVQVNNQTGQTVDFQIQLIGYKVEKQ